MLVAVIQESADNSLASASGLGVAVLPSTPTESNLLPYDYSPPP